MMNNLTKSEVNKYGLYGFTTTIGVMVPMAYITIFMTENLLISAALMGTTLLIARIIDFFVGVSAGGIIEKTRMKWGKYRSWIVVLRWVIFGGIVLMFLDTSTLPMWVRVLTVIAGYVGLNASMNFAATAQYGIMAQMSGPSMENRNILSIRTAQWMAAGSIIISAAAIPAINFFTPIVGQSMGYLIVATAFGFVFLIGATTLLNVSKPYDLPQLGEGIPGMPPVTAGDMVKSVFGNSQLLVIMLVNIFFMTGMFAAQGIMAYYFMYVLGNFTLMAVAMTSTTLFGLVASMIGPKIGLKLGKKNAMVMGLLVYGAGNLAIVFFGGVSLTVYIILSCLYTVGMYFFMGFGANYNLDAGEYGLWKTGKDNRSVAMSMMNVPMKIGMALGGALAGYGLAAIGYTAGMTPNPTFISNFMLLFGGAPAICCFLGALVMLFGYKITDADAIKYAKENAEKMASLMAEKN